MSGRTAEAFETALSEFRRGEHETVARWCTRYLDARDPARDPAVELRVIRLLLSASEPWWRDTFVTERYVPLRQVLARADAAASRTGERADRAVALYLRGAAQVVTENLNRSVETLAEALELARASGDRLTELAAIARLGHCAMGRSMTRGLALLQEAHDLVELPGTFRYPEDSVLLEGLRTQLVGYIGVSEFDRGSFDIAEVRLRQSLDGPIAVDSRAMMSNYLGQLLTAERRFEEAEEVLPVTRNFLAELLMTEAFPGRDLPRAAALLDEPVTECARTGFQRSEIAALALGALAALARDDLAEASELSERAVRRLGDSGAMPALRTEEVYKARYDVLVAAGEEAEAAQRLDRAKAEVRRKAASIADPLRRETISPAGTTQPGHPVRVIPAG